MRELFARGLAFIAQNAAAAIIGLTVTVGGGYLWTLSWSGPSSLTITFQDTLGCSGGKLDYLKRRHFSDDFVQLTRGADKLVICDTEVLVTTRTDAPSALANKYPGCLKWIGSSLLMLRASQSICSLPDGSRYVCDGANAHTYPGSSGLGADNQPIPECSSTVLRRFGFMK